MNLAKEWLTYYGPLGLGWVGFAWSMRRLFALQDQLLAALTTNTQALTLLTASIERK